MSGISCRWLLLAEAGSYGAATDAAEDLKKELSAEQFAEAKRRAAAFNPRH